MTLYVIGRNETVREKHAVAMVDEYDGGPVVHVWTHSDEDPWPCLSGTTDGSLTVGGEAACGYVRDDAWVIEADVLFGTIREMLRSDAVCRECAGAVAARHNIATTGAPV